MANTDAFSASIIPFEVPEQMRAFAEKGVSQARDSYAKFKDAAETHNGTIEAVFTTASKGASEYSAKLMEIMKANTTATLDFAQELFGVKSPTEAMELWTSLRQEAVRGFYRPGQGARRAEPEGCDRNRRADQGQRVEAVQAGRLIRPLSLPKKPGRPARAFVLPCADAGMRGTWLGEARKQHELLVRFGTTTQGIWPALPKSGVAPSFRPVRRPLSGPAKDAVVAQLVRAPVCGTGGRWFEPTQLYQTSCLR